MDSLRVDHPAPGVRLLRIHRPEARNALDLATRRELVRELDAAAGDEQVKCVVVAGGERSFAAGADIRELAEVGAIDMLQRGSAELWRATAACPKPMIAAVRGHALGGGCELAMCCDIIVAGPSARFGQPEIRLGIIPGGGGTQRFTRALGKFKAMRYLLTGDVIPAEEASALGLVSELVPDADVERRAIELASQIARLPPLALRQLKDVVLRGADAPLETALALEARALCLLYGSEDKREGMAAFLEKREPRFVGR